MYTTIESYSHAHDFSIERIVIPRGVKVVDDFEKFLENGFPKILISAEPEKVKEMNEFLCQKIGDKADVFISKPIFLEVMTKGVGKGPGILWLADKLGIPHEQTMAFGDSMNDESMIRMCGAGVAMCNGLDYIKEIADYVTEEDNNHDGVGDFVRKYVL